MRPEGGQKGANDRLQSNGANWEIKRQNEQQDDVASSIEKNAAGS